MSGEGVESLSLFHIVSNNHANRQQNCKHLLLVCHYSSNGSYHSQCSCDASKCESAATDYTHKLISKTVSTDTDGSGQTLYLRSMENNKPMQRLHNGCFFVNDTAAQDDLCQSVMASYIEQLQREAQYRKALREGRVAAPDADWGTWNISDRD